MRYLFFLSTLLLLSCNASGTFEPERELVLGHIAGYNEGDPRIEIPATVRRGESFTVRVTTYGDGCVSEGETRVQRQGARELLVLPYDHVVRSGVCTQQLVSLVHEARLVFQESGAGVVRFRGQELASHSTITVERRVSILP